MINKSELKQNIYWNNVTPEDFENADLHTWIEGVGIISTKFEKDFVRCFGKFLRPHPHTPAAPAPQELVSNTYRCCEKCPNVLSKPVFKCNCSQPQHDAAIRNQTLDDFLKEIKGDVDPVLDYIDLDSIEAAYIRLRHQSTNTKGGN